MTFEQVQAFIKILTKEELWEMLDQPDSRYDLFAHMMCFSPRDSCFKKLWFLMDEQKFYVCQVVRGVADDKLLDYLASPRCPPAHYLHTLSCPTCGLREQLVQRKNFRGFDRSVETDCYPSALSMYMDTVKVYLQNLNQELVWFRDAGIIVESVELDGVYDFSDPVLSNMILSATLFDRGVNHILLQMVASSEALLFLKRYHDHVRPRLDLSGYTGLSLES